MTGKSDQAQRLIDDPILQEAFKAVRERYRDMIEETPVSTDGALLDIRKMLRLLKEVEQHLHTVIRDGKLEDLRINEQQGGILQDIKSWKRKQN
jgi:chromatin segregation and condensation protein Rec8/ScpA/Scc1 (kleisin family)